MTSCGTPTRLVVFLFGCSLLQAADWLTDGGNSQRTAWQKDEKILSKATVGEMKLLWKVKLDNQPRQMHNLFPPLIVEKVNTSSGPKQIAIEAGVSDNLYAIDVETGEIIWKKHFENTWTPPAVAPRRPGGDPLCPGGLTATPVIAPTETPGKYTIMAVSWDGRLHQLNVSDGEDVAPPAKFMPPNGKPYALNLWQGVLYTHTAQGCGGNPNFAYAYDLATQRVGTWGPAGGGMWGRTGPALSKESVMYTGTGDGRWDPETGSFGNGVVGLKQNKTTKALELEDYFAPPNAEWLYSRDLDMQVTPAIFDYKGKELMVTGSKECRVFLMDTNSIGGDDHRHPLFTTPLICNEDVNFASAGIWGSMASWQDSKGTRWVLTPFWGAKHSKFSAPIENGEVKNGAVAAFKVEEKNGKFQLTPAWISRDMNRAEPPVIANGIVYGFGSGEDTDQAYPDIGLDDVSERRIPGGTHAVLYALDAQTGKELWSSGDQITSWNHWSGLSVANGRVYIGTFDSNLYCFGIKK
jgi:outer membrane protein assembly factor BamB